MWVEGDQKKVVPAVVPQAVKLNLSSPVFCVCHMWLARGGIWEEGTGWCLPHALAARSLQPSLYEVALGQGGIMLSRWPRALPAFAGLELMEVGLRAQVSRVCC